MRFKNEGIAFAHLTLPPDLFRQEADDLAAQLRSLGDAYSRHKLTFLTGQSDLLLELRLADLRSAFQLDYESNATGTNWLFAIPFEHTESEPLPNTQLALRYIVHLRVNRDLYRARGADAESEIVSTILGLATRYMTAEVSAGFGWSDLLVSGEFVRRDDFVRFMGKLHHLRLGSTDAFQRLLTIVGYDANLDFAHVESTEVLRPIILARAVPTHIRKAADYLESVVQGAWRKIVLDGKWDILMVLEDADGVPAKGFLERHCNLITGGALQSVGIQRLETHILGQESSEQGSDDDAAGGNNPQTCSICSSAVRKDEELARSMDLLPRSLTVAVRNVLNLFRAASREGNTCCDIVPSLVRCEIGLDRLLRHHRSLHQRMQNVSRIDAGPNSPSGAAWTPHVVKARHDIEAWCTYSERIVSQRTVGRFEEFLAQNERVVSYRGGIQKLLYLADELLNSYAQRVYASEEEPALMSLYDPIELVESMRVVGFVRIPVRYIFVLPLAISHLWHEVGVHWFYSKYWNPVDTRTRERLHNFRPKVEEETASNLERVDLLIDLADMYGDAVTLAKGFRFDLPHFIMSLTSALLEANAFQTAPEPIRRRFLVQLLVRLYMVSEFLQRCEFVRELPRKKSISLSRAELDQWVPSATLFVAPRIANIATIIRRELLDHSRYDGVAISPEIEKDAVDAIAIVATTVHRRYASELAWELGGETVPDVSPESKRAFESVLRGEVVSLNAQVDINDLFMLVQRQLLNSLRRSPRAGVGEAVPPSFLRPIAALVRSSLLAFYQRNGKPSRRSNGRVDISGIPRVYREGPITIKESDLLDEDVNV